VIAAGMVAVFLAVPAERRALEDVIVGFAAQRFLMDVIAGALIAFERWYGVGDFIMVEPAKASGIVEQFSLRTTVIGSLNGDRAYVPNSQIIAAIRSPRGYRRYSIELLTNDPERARRAIEAAGRRAPVGRSPVPTAAARDRRASSERTHGSSARGPTSHRRSSGSPRATSSASSSPTSRTRSSPSPSSTHSTRVCFPATSGAASSDSGERMVPR
jgi:hypothetical protein